jgi:hypothetical protein
MDLQDKIRVIEDFPKPGIRFKDITTLLKDGRAYKEAIDRLAEYAVQQGAEVIVGPEASTMISEAALSLEMAAFLEDLSFTIHPHPTLGAQPSPDGSGSICRSGWIATVARPISRCALEPSCSSGRRAPA